MNDDDSFNYDSLEFIPFIHHHNHHHFFKVSVATKDQEEEEEEEKMATSFVVDRENLKQRLTNLQYNVTQNGYTEEPFTGEYNNCNDGGIYSCIVCEQQLFTSETKYESGCGWPAFFDSLDMNKLCFKPDYKKAPRIRTEITCAKCDAHLGHLFENGPKPTGKRYCINSASLKFERFPQQHS